MDIKHKIMIILGICFFLCIGAYFIITNMFESIEEQLFEKCRMEAQIGSRAMSEMMELMIISRLVPEKDLFDTNYVAIAGSNPKKYSTKYDKTFDKLLQRFEDELVLNDRDMVYAVLVDKNGYAPTHNSHYSKAPTGDTAYNLKYSRSKRMFNDKVGINAARFNGKGTLDQIYPRDTGETILDISAPVMVRGKHWGAFRVGVSFNRINHLKNQMLLIIVMTIFVIISVTMLMLFLIIPRKLLIQDLDMPKY